MLWTHYPSASVSKTSKTSLIFSLAFNLVAIMLRNSSSSIVPLLSCNLYINSAPAISRAPAVAPSPCYQMYPCTENMCWTLRVRPCCGNICGELMIKPISFYQIQNVYVWANWEWNMITKCLMVKISAKFDHQAYGG